MSIAKHLSSSSQSLWPYAVLSLAGLVLLPLSVIFLSWLNVDGSVWQHLIDTQLGRLLRNTGVLVIGVGVGVSLLGVSLAWLVSLCEFPGRRWLDWALMLPMAIPAYVMAFVFVGLFDFFGPLQQWLHSNIDDYKYIDVRHPSGVIIVFVLVFYPYVYMLARSAFLAQGRSLLDAARLLGASPFKAFFRIGLPMARPAVVAGVSLALMETLADFGAVSVFNFDTFTTAIYKTWYGMFNLSAAAQLASLLLVFVVISLHFEKRARGKTNITQANQKSNQDRYRLKGWQAWSATSFCLLIFSLSFLIPLMQLLVWVFNTGLGEFTLRFARLIWNTLLIGASAALLTTTAALLLALAQRKRPNAIMDAGVRLANLGYALPGSVLAVGIMLSFNWIEKEILGLGTQYLSSGIFALLLAYIIRFMAVAFGPIDNGFQRIKPSIPEAAKTLGANSQRLLFRIYLPMLRPGLLTAMLMVLVDVMKEMPATLLLRPFGWDTLAVRIYEMTSEGEWERAALPAVMLVLVGLIPVIYFMRKSRS
jgi:iron(III) transport system permease protein